MKKSLLLIFAVVLSIAINAQSSSVEIWIRAFIPNPQNAGSANGYIHTVSGVGSCVSLHNINPAVPNLCFATDNRGFSTSTAVSSRLETKFTLTLNANNTGTVTPQSNRTTAAITKKVNCQTGAVLQQGQGSIDRDNIGTPAVANGTIQVIGQAQGTNLLTPAGSAGPSIDYSFDIQWTGATSTITAAVTFGSFPAIEVYARKPGGVWVAVIQSLPTGEPWKLGGDSFGINSQRVVTTKKL